MNREPASTPRRDTVLLLALLLVYFLLMIGARPLNIPDEGRYPEVAREMLQTGDFVTPRNNGIVFLDKPALYYWLQALAMALLGVEVWTIRLVPALFAVAGCLMTFLTTRRLYSRRAAWLAVATLAAQPLYYLSSQYADMNMEVGVWIAVSLMAFLLADRSEGRERRRWLLAMYVAAGCAFLTKGLIGVVFPLMVIGAWVLVLGRWREVPRYGLPWGLALVVAINLPWYALVQRANPEFLHYFFVYQQVDRYADTGFNNAQPWWYYPAILAGGLLPWSLLLPAATRDLWRRWRADRERGRHHLFLLLWPWLIVLFFCIPESKISSYLLPAIPPLAMALGAYLDAWLARAEPAGWRRAVAYVPVAAGTAALVGALLWRGDPDGRLIVILCGVSWLLGGLAALLMLERRQAVHAWAIMAAGTGLGLLLLVPLAPHFTQYSSSRPLAERLKPALRDDTLLISYRNYLNDLPLYLQPRQRILVVDRWDDPALAQRDNWRREFWLGLQDHPEARQWLKQEHELPGLLQGGRDAFLIVRRAELAHVQRHYPGLHLWGSFDRVLLFGNRPPPANAQ